MKKILKIVLGIFVGFALFLGVALAYVKWALPNHVCRDERAGFRSHL